MSDSELQDFIAKTQPMLWKLQDENKRLRDGLAQIANATWNKGATEQLTARQYARTVLREIEETHDARQR